MALPRFAWIMPPSERAVTAGRSWRGHSFIVPQVRPRHGVQSFTPYNARRLRHRQGQPADEAQHRVGAGRHGKAVQQPRNGLTAQRRSGLALDLGQPGGAERTRDDQLRQALGEGAPGAFGVATMEPSYPQPDTDPAPC